MIIEQEIKIMANYLSFQLMKKTYQRNKSKNNNNLLTDNDKLINRKK